MSEIRIVLVAEADMRADITRSILVADPDFDVVGVVERPDQLPSVLAETAVDVVVVQPLAPELPRGLGPILGDATGPRVVGVDRAGALGVVMVDHLGADELRAAVRASLALRSGTDGEESVSG